MASLVILSGWGGGGGGGEMREFYSDSTHFINTLALDVILVHDSRNYFQSC